MPEHVAYGRRIAESAGVSNLAFHALDFAAAVDLDLPPFQYIVAHGVYAWIDDAARAAFRRFIARHLAPGGLVYVSYNSMPGWAADGPFQHLVLALSAHETGDSMQKFEAAAAAVQGLTKAGAAALAASGIASQWDDEKSRRPRAYFAHEYLAPSWRPLYVDEMRREMAEAGLVPVGSATLRDNFDSFVLRSAARDALATIADADLRELARDYFLFQRFRRDVFGQAPARLDDEERRRRLFAATFALARPPDLVEYAMPTEAGRVSFDNPVAHRIVSALQHGHRSLNACRDAGDTAQDVLANAIALSCAGMISPAAAGRAEVERLNAALLDGPGAETGSTFRVTPFATALRFDSSFLSALRDGGEIAEEARPWVEYLRQSS
jgi:SAM-dependent methyltransferase